MMGDVIFLCLSAMSIGIVHTLLGPDHYLPFVAVSRAGRWSLNKTVLITLLCGLGHVLSSVVLGTVGMAFGAGVLKLEAFEGFRAELAGWMLLAFGLAYFVWGVRRAMRNKPHTHLHVHADGTVHSHEHVHTTDHVHVHVQARNGQTESITPWVLFTVFVFGPCEPLIPLLMYPAAKGSVTDVVLVVAVFALATLTTMTVAVVLLRSALERVQSAASGLFGRMERYSHALAALVILACGAAIKMGL